MQRSIGFSCMLAVLLTASIALAHGMGHDEGEEPMMEQGMMQEDMMGKEMMGQGMEEGMRGKQMMMKQGMKKRHRMQEMMGKSSMVASNDGGVIILKGNKLLKYDKNLNLVKEVELKVPSMEEMMKKGHGMGPSSSEDQNNSGHEGHH